MARTRRAAQSAPQEVLVPEAEQPYAVPENWRWVRLGSTITLYRGVTYKKSDAHTSKQPNDCLILRGGNIQDGIISFFNDNIYVDMSFVKPEQLLQKNDIVIVTSTGSYKVIGKSAAVQEDFRDVAFGAFLTLARPLHIYNKVYIYYFFQSVFFREHLRRLASGTSINNLKTAHITECVFPLPPRAEQERIVARIESLFARLDKAREKVDAVLGRCAARKAALLHKAFSGELTAGKAIKNILLEDIVLDIKIGPFGSMLHKDDYISNGVPIVNPKHIEGQKILVAINNTISKDKAEELAVYALKENDIVLGRRGEMGRCAPVSCAESGWICGTGSMIIRLKPEYNAKFYSLFISSCQGMRYLEEHAVGTTLKNLNEKIVRKLPVPSFSQQEQAEIVRILDELLARERRAQEAAERVAARIEQIKRAVLTKAFRGELGTNDPAEPAALTEQGSLSLA